MPISSERIAAIFHGFDTDNNNVLEEKDFTLAGKQTAAIAKAAEGSSHYKTIVDNYTEAWKFISAADADHDNKVLSS